MMSDYKAKQRKQEKAIQSSKEGTLGWDSGGKRVYFNLIPRVDSLVYNSTGGRTYYKGANQIKKANKGMRARLMRLMEKMQ
jgi:hypothetical protein